MFFIEISDRGFPLPFFSIMEGVGCHITIMHVSILVRIRLQEFSVLHTVLPVFVHCRAIPVNAVIIVKKIIRVRHDGKNGQSVIKFFFFISYKINAGNDFTHRIVLFTIADRTHNHGFIHRKRRRIISGRRKVRSRGIHIFPRTDILNENGFPVYGAVRRRIAAIQCIIDHFSFTRRNFQRKRLFIEPAFHTEYRIFQFDGRQNLRFLIRTAGRSRHFRPAVFSVPYPSITRIVYKRGHFHGIHDFTRFLTAQKNFFTAFGNTETDASALRVIRAIQPYHIIRSRRKRYGIQRIFPKRFGIVG